MGARGVMDPSAPKPAAGANPADASPMASTPVAGVRKNEDISTPGATKPVVPSAPGKGGV